MSSVSPTTQYVIDDRKERRKKNRSGRQMVHLMSAAAFNLDIFSTLFPLPIEWSTAENVIAREEKHIESH